MKNLTTILTELGIEVPEEKKSELEKQLGENYKPVSEVEKVRTARDNYKAQLDTAQETLKGFEGVDVNELQGRISTLQNDLAAQKTAFEQQISDMEFNSMLEDAIGKAGARSVKAVKAELDIDAIKASKISRRISTPQSRLARRRTASSLARTSLSTTPLWAAQKAAQRALMQMRQCARHSVCP